MTQRAAVRLPAAPASIGQARRAVLQALDEWGLEHLVETATLLVSELATNAVLHARSELEVRVERRAGGFVRIAVCDASSRLAVRRRYGLDAGTGRGLGLVETLSADWGCEELHEPWAKVVWFELAETAGDQEPTFEGALYGESWLALVDDL